MPLSHTYKLLFIHIPKCAGISVWHALDIAETPENLITFAPPVLQHMLPKQLKGKYIDSETWNTFKKFSIIRNPYNRVVSDYFWMKNDSNARRLITGSFDDFLTLREDVVRHNRYADDMYFDHFYPMHFYFQGITYDHVLRFENLNAEFEELRTLYHIEKPLPKVNRSEKGGFVLNEEQQERIYKLYQKDFTLFKYKKKYIAPEPEVDTNQQLNPEHELIRSLQAEVQALHTEKNQLDQESKNLLLQVREEKDQLIRSLENERNHYIGEVNVLRAELHGMNNQLLSQQKEQELVQTNQELKDKLISELTTSQLHLETELKELTGATHKAAHEKAELEKALRQASGETRAAESKLQETQKGIVRQEELNKHLTAQTTYLERLLQQEKETNQKAISIRESQLSQLNEDKAMLVSELAFYKEVIQKLNEEKGHQEQRYLLAASEIRVLEKTLAEREKNFRALETELKHSKTEVEKMESQALTERKNHSRQALEAKGEAIALLKIKDSLTSELAAKNEQFSAVSTEYRHAESRYQEQKNQLEIRLTQLSDKIADKDSMIAKLKKTGLDLENSVNWYRETYETRSLLGILKDRFTKR